MNKKYFPKDLCVCLRQRIMQYILIKNKTKQKKPKTTKPNQTKQEIPEWRQCFLYITIFLIKKEKKIQFFFSIFFFHFYNKYNNVLRASRKTDTT